jgi:TldD protein
MKEIENGLDTAKALGAEYCDIRLVKRKEEFVSVKNEHPDAVRVSEDTGVGVRVIVQGAWGFASSSDLSKLNSVIRSAIEIAEVSATANRKKVELSEAEPVVANYETPFAIDPFSVPLEKKIDLLIKACSEMDVSSKIALREGSVCSFYEEKIFANTEGSYITQRFTETGAGIVCIAIDGSEVQVRSYPNSFRGNFAKCGFEFVKELSLIENGQRIGEEAVELLSAEKVPEGLHTIIIDGGQMCLQIHESIGHPIELDRILGTEAAYAGESFLRVEDIKSLRYASDIVNITADATIERGFGSFGYDDEGVPAQRIDIIKDGILVGLLTSRETAKVLGEKSSGCMRADGWSRIPLIRMTNINLEPGEWSLEELIADTEYGFYLETNKSWSIDNRRLNFEFETEIAREIRAGKLGRIFKNPVYTGITPQFWKSCDAICDKNHWKLWGVPNCGKGQPGQSAHVGHGTSPARFRNVKML